MNLRPGLIALVLLAGIVPPASTEAAEVTKAALTFGDLVQGRFREGREHLSEAVVAADGSIYVVGTSSPRSLGDGDPSGDIMVKKLTPDAREVVWQRYLDSQDGDRGEAIALGPDGSVYVSGGTFHGDFPTTEGAYRDGSECGSVLVRFTPEGDQIFSTYVAESGGSCPGPAEEDLVVDADGNAYLIGTATDYSCAEEGVTVIGEGQPIAPLSVFVAQITADGSGRPWATCIYGNGGFSGGSGIDLLPDGRVVLTGLTDATDLGTGGHDDTMDGKWDAFLATLAQDGRSIDHFTYLGGRNGDSGSDVELTSDGDAIVTGDTGSGGLATPGAAQPDKSGKLDRFVARFAADGSELDYATYLGGELDDHGANLAVDETGAVALVGLTESKRFPVRRQFQTRLQGDGFDGYVAVLEPDGRFFRYVSYLGGSRYDFAQDVDLLPDGSLLVVGDTSGTDIPLIDRAPLDNVGPSSGTIHFVAETASKCDLLGGPGGDSLWGSPEGDVVCGGGGPDRLFGRDGDDLLLGGPGRDRCKGGPGRDRERSC